MRTGSPLTRRRRRGSAAEALDDENDADLFGADALNDAALASVAKLWAVLIKYTLRCCTRTLTTKHERMGKRTQAADDAWVVAITKHSGNPASSNYITRSTTWSC